MIVSKYIDTKYSDQYNALAVALLSVRPILEKKKKMLCALLDIDGSRVFVSPKDLILETREKITQWLPDALGDLKAIKKVHNDRFVEEYELQKIDPCTTVLSLHSGKFV